MLNGGYLTDESRGGTPRIKRVGNTHEFAEQYTKVHASDWNGDGLLDLLIGYSGPCIQLLLNEGTAKEPVFNKAIAFPLSSNPPATRPNPVLFDWDRDGKRDLVVGTEWGNVVFFANTGEDRNPRFAEGKGLEAVGKPIKLDCRVRIAVCDWNNDGVPDLVAGNCYHVKDPKMQRVGGIRGNVWLFAGTNKSEAGKQAEEKKPEGKE